MKKIALQLLLFISTFLLACNDQKDKSTDQVDSTSKTEKEIKELPIAESDKQDSAHSVASQDTEKVVASKKIGSYSVDVLSVKVIGAVLSVDLRINNPDKKYVDIKSPLKNIFLIDDAIAKKSNLLKDDLGKYLASPTDESGVYLLIRSYELGFAVNLKFPAPTIESKSVSVTIPSLGGFDGLPLKRL